jgi:hypothetical protein
LCSAIVTRTDTVRFVARYAAEHGYNLRQSEPKYREHGHTVVNFLVFPRQNGGTKKEEDERGLLNIPAAKEND